MARSSVKIRKLRRADLQRGFLESLDSLRKASDIGRRRAESILERISSNKYHLIFVAEIDGRVVGSITLLIEQKFIHCGGRVGHIEDVVVSNKMQGLGIGEKLVRFALDYAAGRGCYKTILDCDKKVRPFYERIGFEVHSHGMRYDH